MLENERQIGATVTQELEIRLLVEHARPERGARHLDAARVDVLQVGDDEAILEPPEELGGGAVLRRQEMAREVVVRITNDLEVRRREALEQLEQSGSAS